MRPEGGIMNQVIELQRFSNALFDTLDETSIGGALVFVVPTAYHLGEMRQAHCMLK